MFKFFRKIRQRLLGAGNFRKYFVYAAGEIFLVVIGILIALQVNNWNEKRKNQDEVKALLELLEKELTENIAADADHLAFCYRKDSLIQLVLSEKVTRKMYYQERDLHNLILNLRLGGPTKDVLEKVLRKEENFPKHLQYLLPVLKEYQEGIQEYDTGESQIVVGQIAENYTYFVNNYAWFSRNDSIALADKIEYFLSDPIYRNRVDMYKNVFLLNGARRRTELRSRAIALLLQLRMDASLDIRQWIETQGLSSFAVLDCESEVLPSPRRVQFPFYPLVINEKNQPFTLYKLGKDGQRTNSIKFIPGDIKADFSLGPVSEGDVFEWRDQNGCTGRFAAVKDGYLIIE